MAYGDLTTLADVRAWLQTGPQPYPATDDLLLSRLITAASQFIQSWLNRPLLSADWQEIRDGLGSFTCEQTWVCGVQPVTNVILVVVNDLTIPADPTGYLPSYTPAPPGQISPTVTLLLPTDGAGYTFTPSAITVRGYYVPYKKGCVLLQYTAGFPSVPFDVSQATIELVCRKYRERTRIGERSKSLGGGETVSYETTSFSLRDMASDIQVLLQQYRMVAPVFGLPSTPAPTSFDPATLAALA
jgi:hypothetical protein